MPFVDVQPLFGEQLAERVAVLLSPQRRQHRNDEAAAAQFEAKVVKQRWVHD